MGARDTDPPRDADSLTPSFLSAQLPQTARTYLGSGDARWRVEAMVWNRSAGDARLVGARKGDFRLARVPQQLGKEEQVTAPDWAGGAAGSAGRAARAGRPLSLGARACSRRQGQLLAAAAWTIHPWLLRIMKGYLFPAFGDVSLSPQGRASDHLVLLSLLSIQRKENSKPQLLH